MKGNASKQLNCIKGCFLGRFPKWLVEEFELSEKPQLQSLLMNMDRLPNPPCFRPQMKCAAFLPLSFWNHLQTEKQLKAKTPSKSHPWCLWGNTSLWLPSERVQLLWKHLPAPAALRQSGVRHWSSLLTKLMEVCKSNAPCRYKRWTAHVLRVDT